MEGMRDVFSLLPLAENDRKKTARKERNRINKGQKEQEAILSLFPFSFSHFSINFPFCSFFFLIIFSSKMNI